MDRRALDAAPIPTAIIRDGRIVHASPAALRLLGLPAESVLDRPYIGFVVPEEVGRLQEREARRLRGERTPATYETTLLGGRGARVPVQVTAAVEGADIIVQLLDIRDRMEQRHRLNALARLGARVQAERAEGAVLAAARDGLFALGLRSALVRPEGEDLRVVFAHIGRSQERYEEALGLRLHETVRPWTPWARRIWAEGAGYTDDWAGEVASYLGPSAEPLSRELTEAEGFAHGIGVRIDLGGAPSAILFAMGDWPRQGDVPIFQLFGTQVQAALAAARTIRDLEDRNAELAALNRLAATAAMAPDLPTFFQRGAEEVGRALGCQGLAIWLHDEERGVLELAHHVGSTPEAVHAARRIPVAGSRIGEVLVAQAPRVLYLEDYPEPVRGAVAGTGLATHVSVPLVVRAKAVGVMNAGFRDRLDARSARLELFHAMAGPFAAAVEAQRLLGDFRRRVSDLEAVNALALSIFALPPGDTQAVLEAASRDVGEALEARATVTFLFDERQGLLRSAATWGSPVPSDPIRVPLDGAGLASEALRTQAPVQCEDSSTDPRSGAHGAPAPAMSMLMVPLTSRQVARGVMAVAREPGHRFGDAEVALASALASAAAMGLENAELHAETRRRLEELGVLLEVGRSLVATLDLDQVLDAGVRNLARMVGAPDAYLFLADPSRTRLEVRAASGSFPELVGSRVPVRPAQDSLAALVFERREPLVVESGAELPGISGELLGVAEGSAYLGLPLVVRDRTIGTALIVDPRGPRRFVPAEVERAAAVANQLAVAVENARLYEDLRKSYADLAHAHQQLVHQERLAALGELSAVVAHEVRNPLGVIFNSLGSLRRLLRPQGDARMLLDIVGEEAERLNRIVGDLLDFARPATPVLRPESLPRLLDDALPAALGENPEAIAVEREVDPALPAVPMDARLMRQAVVNVAVNAVQAMQRGGRLTIRARREAGAVCLEIADTGPGIPEEVRHRIFEPFFTTRASGTGLGLAVVKRIVEGHGGEVTVTSAPGRTVFAIRLPIEAAPAPGARPG